MERMIILTEKDYQELIDKNIALEEENKTLKDNVEFLHSCLDDRDKSIAIMQEENEKLKKYYDRDKEELMESCYGLAKENDELKEKLKQIEEAYVKLEKENKG